MAADKLFFFFFFIVFFFFTVAVADRRYLQEAVPPSQQSSNATAFSPFKPSIAVIIAILTMFFCITFLVLLYAKHCNSRGDGGGGGNGVVGFYFGGGGGGVRGTSFPVCTRKNSGVDRSLVESLPVFRFASLRGQKDGLECAVCLNRFESVEVLRLLPKCKHAFHVECVDTWLDAHSTCPLCRYRVDPEDLLLVVEPVSDVDPVRPVEELRPSSDRKPSVDSVRKSFAETIRRISGRHSSAGERGPLPEEMSSMSSYRRSYDVAAVGCFDRQYRKDGLLMTAGVRPPPVTGDRKLDHRIIISDDMGPASRYERWSDVQPSDLLYLRSEMVMNERRKRSGGRAINGRSVSELTGLSRMAVTAAGNVEAAAAAAAEEEVEIGESQKQRLQSKSNLVGESREAGALSRWTAWISQSRDLRS